MTMMPALKIPVIVKQDVFLPRLSVTIMTHAQLTHVVLRKDVYIHLEILMTKTYVPLINVIRTLDLSHIPLLTVMIAMHVLLTVALKKLELVNTKPLIVMMMMHVPLILAVLNLDVNIPLSFVLHLLVILFLVKRTKDVNMKRLSVMIMMHAL
jgi:hypothetical protein